MRKKVKVEWLQNFNNNRKDSIWYGGDIVKIIIGRYHITIGAYGDVRAYINGEHYVDKCNGGCFAEYLPEQEIYNDDDLLRAIEENRIEFENNNWYEAFIWDNKKGDYVDTYDTVIDELDENDDFAWVEDWLKPLVG